MKINKKYFIDFTNKIFSIPSPSGMCKEVINLIEEETKKYDYSFERTPKGNGIITIEGKDPSYVVGLSAHVDTLGAMVRSITSSGELKFTNIGGPIWPTIDGEYCKIHTREGKVYTGTFLSTSESIHVYKDAKDKKRDPENMIIRIDEVVKSKDDVLKLGINAGDYVSFDPKTTITESDFIKSRFLDDKISVVALFCLMEYLHKNNIRPNYTVKIIISTYEEVGHGSSWIPQDINELIAIDMGAMGDDLNCTEYDVSICAKDSSGPYDYDIVNKLIELAKQNKLDYAIDIYPYYGSDVTAALRGGNNIRGGLIGPGVHASHGMERTHYTGVENTIKLLYFYLTK